MTSNKKVITLIIVIIVLLIAFLVTFFFMFKTMDEKNETYRENLKIQSELEVLMAEHNLIKQQNLQFQDQLSERDSIILANSAEIQKLLNVQYDYRKIKKKLETLQGIAWDYVQRIDSLQLVNIALIRENGEIKQEVAMQKEVNKLLTAKSDSLGQRINEAAVLKAYNISVVGMRRKAKSEVETEDAGKIEKLVVKFTIGENKVVPAGNKNIYLRIARPDGEILSRNQSDDATFEYEGKKLQYSLTEKIYYDKSAKDMAFVWLKSDKSEKAMKGNYEVNIYVDNLLIGIGHLTLK
ncbi:MAG: hypothetical protein LBC89_02705 [Bacteroidales bacterium]|jgi:hypothetical protein|nr:hypothetical protein [Bacteroidales bacterium]